MIDVVIAAYRGLAETRACVESVLAAGSAPPHQVIVIDDASPEPGLSAWLREVAESGRITLVEHGMNRGFVATANEGMAMHPERDVVLLNSDTEVAPGWLERLAAHAADATVGTVTPFSNNATVCSYPMTLAANAMPPHATTASLDRACAEANRRASVEIPTAVGFCMFISRRCIDRIGPFDEARYGTGYGEEVDFCMRAARAGFRHLLAADVFVKHVGEVSFGSSGTERRAKAQALVDSLYPEFQPRVREHIAKDPARALRRRVDLERLRRSKLPRVLFVAHAYGGGVRRHVMELAAAAASRCEILLLTPYLRSYVELTWITGTEELRLWFHHERDWPRLEEILRAVGISRVHYHHVHGMPLSILDLAERVGCAHDVTVHDYFPVCPRYHLTDPSGRYCGERGEAGCMRCLDGGPIQWPLDIVQWRERFHVLLRSATRVIAPSRDCAARIRRYFPDVQVSTWPHGHSHSTTSPRPVMVIVPGALSPEKGLDVVEDCARDAHTRELPLHFRVVGYVARPVAVWPDAPVTITGEYREGTLEGRIALEDGDVVFLPAQVPETFSYTLTAAMETGLPIVATDLGALPERLAGYGSARIVAWDAGGATMNDALLDCAARRPPRALQEAPDASGLPEYAAGYLQGIEPRAPESRVPDLEAHLIAPPSEDLPIATLAQLFDDGVLCGRAASLVELRRRALEADAALATAAATQAENARLREASRRAADLQARWEHADTDRRTAEARAAELEASTTWRLTAPLRALIHRLRGRR